MLSRKLLLLTFFYCFLIGYFMDHRKIESLAAQTSNQNPYKLSSYFELDSEDSNSRVIASEITPRTKKTPPSRINTFPLKQRLPHPQSRPIQQKPWGRNKIWIEDEIRRQDKINQKNNIFIQLIEPSIHVPPSSIGGASLNSKCFISQSLKNQSNIINSQILKLLSLNKNLLSQYIESHPKDCDFLVFIYRLKSIGIIKK